MKISAKSVVGIFVPIAASAGAAHAQLRVVDYNTAGDSRAGMQTILAAIGAESASGVVRPPDVMTLEEQDNSATTTQAIVNVLNAQFGAGTYARSTFDAGTTGGGRVGLIYRPSTVALIASTAASTTSSTGAARQTARYELRPTGYGAASDFYVYVSHYKAQGDTPSEDAARRANEALQVRQNADALGQGTHIIYTGDFNVYKSSEAMWTNLTAAGNGQAFDPVNRVGAWDTSSFKDVHTQSPATTMAYGGQVTGGMDNRFDFQLGTAETLSGEGLAYIPGTYRAFGNTNTHTFNGAVTTGSAAALAARIPGYSTVQATGVLNALATTSDHLPVVADYQLPAKMKVTVGAVPTKVIRGANVNVGVTVANVAPVAVAIGADELDYGVTSTGPLTVAGAGTGSVAALAAGASHSVSLDTSAAGKHTGSIAVNSSSDMAADASFSQAISVDVLDHANASFATSADVDSTTSVFPNAQPNSGISAVHLSLANLQSSPGFTAGLDLDDVFGSGRTDVLTLSLTAGAHIAAGGSVSFDALLDTAGVAPGHYEAVYLFKLSDEDLAGATNLADLKLTLSATVVPEPAGWGFAGGGLLLVALHRRRQRKHS